MSAAGASRPAATALALTGLRVWDGVSAAREERPSTIRIENGAITAIGSDATLVRGAEVHSLEGATAIPGLIDAHVHLTLDPAISSPAEQLRVPEERLVGAMEARALAMLQAGITTARDLGGGAWLEVRLRDRIARGEVPGPRLLCAGQPVTTRGGHCHFWGGEAETPDEIRAVVRRQVEREVDWIKVMATGGVLTRGTPIREAQFDRERLSTLVGEARALGRPVAAHCHGTAGIRNAVEARVTTIEHCSWAGSEGFGSDLDASVADRMAAQRIWVSPTVNAGWRRFLTKGDRPSRFSERMTACFETVRRAGVKLIASTDAGIPGVRHERLAEALSVFAEFAALSPLRALRAATSDAASGLGLVGETGALRPGLAADVLVVDGNPLDDLAALERPRLVVARGRVFYADSSAGRGG